MNKIKELAQRLLNKIKSFDFEGLFIPISITLLLIVIALLAFSCNTTKRMTDNSKTATTDSVRSEYIYIRDTSFIENTRIIRDSIFFESTGNTQVIFSKNGGTYNVKTGEASGVVNVSSSSSERKLQGKLDISNKNEMNLTTMLKASRDSLKMFKESKDIKEYKKTTMAGWYIYLIVGFLVGIAFIIFLKKFPYTAPFFFWL
ncbi:MAG TPA: hypothetical protein PL049_09150 [Sedimentibacter sp.]|nr:hypothetical protein [Sedimentibacter sp.]